MDHPDQLRTRLAAIRRRWLAMTVWSAAGRSAAGAALPLGAAAAAGWFLKPAGGGLMVLGAVTLALELTLLVFLFGRRPRRPDDRRVARFVEEQWQAGGHLPDLRDALVSAVQVAEAPDDHAPSFARAIVASAADTLQDVTPSMVVSSDAMRRAVLEGVVGIAIFLAALAAASPYLTRAGATMWVSLFPSTLDLRVLTGNARVAAGQPLRIAAAMEGRGARLLDVIPNLVVTAGGQQRVVAMSRAAGGFEYRFESVDRSFEYRVTAGAATSAAYSVTALFPARVTRIDLGYEYPDFTGQPPREETDGGDVYGPAGTRVRLRIHTDKPIRSGHLSLSGSPSIPLVPVADREVSADLVLTKDDGYRVRLRDVDGLESVGDLEYFVRLMDDRPPDVRIVRPSADQGITPLEEVTIEARADDDHGVAQFDLVYGVAGRATRTVPFTTLDGTAVARIGTHLLAAEDLGVQPGEVITYYARARDVARGKRSTESRSDIFFLEVKPFNEEFVAAQSQGMGGGQAGAQIDSLIAAQKEIINATWNLERRSGAGRSEADLKAVGQAQAELKSRAEQMVRGGRRPPGLFPPQQIEPSPQAGPRRGTGDPVRAAIDAMGRAVEQLGHSRTEDALPHEMAALQGLLQAQAEVRRRQVMQQSANSAGQGGTSRMDRDLSALFDRELQRQQRTNYETPRSSQESEPQESSDALERIRDLARRQEEMAKRQRDLAGARLAADEMKRQLERLTRDQEELRRQAEAIEKQLQQQSAGAAPGQPSKGASGGSQGRQGADEVRRAADQMRSAASELQRQNLQGAAASGAKAADALRQTEQRLRGGSTSALQRAAGDLRLEAQQVAEAQRRVAAEMSRLEKDGQGAGNGERLRRLAGEKDRLADRVDALERGARDLERQTPGPGGQAYRDAAQELQGQRIGERMRATADALRGRAGSPAPANTSPSAAQTEQQLARALDGVVDRLAGGDSRQLTNSLDQAREMRDRLSELEGRVREAENAVRNGREGRAAAAPQRGREGQGSTGSGGGPSPEQQLQRARDEYGRELQRSRETLSRLQGSSQQNGLGGSTPEQHEFSRSAPGNEAFKQDFTGWDALRKDVDLRLERYESAVAARLSRQLAADRLSGGGSERVPDAYVRSVPRYFESLAKEKR